MSKLGLLQQYGPCECDEPNLHQIDHAEILHDSDGTPQGSETVTDYKCHDCNGVRFER